MPRLDLVCPYCHEPVVVVGFGDETLDTCETHGVIEGQGIPAPEETPPAREFRLPCVRCGADHDGCDAPIVAPHVGERVEHRLEPGREGTVAHVVVTPDYAHVWVQWRDGARSRTYAGWLDRKGPA